MMMQQEVADNYVIATGKQYSVREFIFWAATELGIALRFDGSGVDETAVVVRISGDKVPAVKVCDVLMRIDSCYFRPAEVETLLGDHRKAKRTLGWEPMITAQEMCAEMVAADLLTALRRAMLKVHELGLPVSFED